MYNLVKESAKLGFAVIRLAGALIFLVFAIKALIGLIIS